MSAREFRADLNALPIRELWNVIANFERELHLARTSGSSAAWIRELSDRLLITRHVLRNKLRNSGSMGGKRKRVRGRRRTIRGRATSAQMMEQMLSLRTFLQNATDTQVFRLLAQTQRAVDEIELRVRAEPTARNYAFMDSARTTLRIILAELARRGLA